MSEPEVPEEILHIIFSNLPGFTVLQCRKVCRRWRDAVDRLSDSCWKKICSQDYLREEYAKVRQKHGLSWHSAYTAVHSWSKIHNAEMKISKLCKHVQMFKVLPNGLIACLQNNNFQTTNIRHFFCCDTIVYYNTDTYQEAYRLEFDFPFSSMIYDENEHLIVLFHDNGQMCVIVKETQKQFFVGTLEQDVGHFGIILPMQRFGAFALIGKEIYFQSSNDGLIYVSKLIEEKGEKIVKTTPLEAFDENHDSFEENVIAFSVTNGLLHILSDEGLRANVYVHENADFGWASGIDFDLRMIFDELQEFGFDWRAPRLYNWLSGNIPFKKKVFFSQGLMAMSTRSACKTICFHSLAKCRLSALYDVDRLLKSKPLRRVTLSEIIPPSKAQRYSYIKKFDVIETGYSHKVVVMIENSLYLIEFRPAAKENKPRKPVKKTKPKMVVKKKGIKTLGNKQAKAKLLLKKARNLSHKHVYATRSSTKLL